MRIGILNLYWNTRGGGERYSGTIAQILSRAHDVDLIGGETVDINGLARGLGLDLSRVRYRQAETKDLTALSELTAEYDLFVNATFWSGLVSRAKHSAYVAYFPHPLLGKLRSAVVRLTSAALEHWGHPAVEPIAGFFPLETGETAWRWSGPQARIKIFPRAFHDGIAKVRFLPKGPRSLAETLKAVHGQDVGCKVLGDSLIVEHRATPRHPIEITLDCRTFRPVDLDPGGDSRRLGLCLEVGTKHRLLDHPFVRRLQRRLRSDRQHADSDFLASYDVLIAISAYTQRWIEKRWARPSSVLAPPVDTETFSAPPLSEKHQTILSVGRFFAGNHNKKHPELLKVFRQMCDRGSIGPGWEYHVAGNVHRSTPGDKAYFAEVQRLAVGYPVKVLPDLPLERLLDEYRRASIFWHAAGWGENENRQPEKLEHFGITTCEAMSSGCVPVVFAKAGQLEIVQDGVNGFLFRSRPELIERTTQLITKHQSSEMQVMRRAAIESVQRFGTAAFERNLLSILSPYLTA